MLTMNLSRTGLVWLMLAVGGSKPAAGQDSLTPATQAWLPVSQIPWDKYVRDITRLYQLAGGGPIWFQGRRISAAGTQAVQGLLQAQEHGLRPQEYDAKMLDSLAQRSGLGSLSTLEQERFDALLSVDLIRYLDDLQFGRLHPPLLDRSGADQGIDLAEAIHSAIAADSMPRLIAAAAPQLAQYRNLQRLLLRYRELAVDTDLRPIRQTAPVTPGKVYPDLWSLRRLLVAMGDLEPAWATDLSGVYTRHDAAAVRRFQIRHALRATGLLDSATVAAVNVPFGWRVRQIELALERLRWLPPIGHQRFLVVNVPAFQLFAFDSVGGTGSPAISMRVIVGNALDTRTPVLFERMRYIEFRPYWYVPASITTLEIVPQLQANPEYLARNEIDILARGGRIVDSTLTPEMVERLRRGELRLRQRPGANNPLGLVKFVFPNAASIYLHGTTRPDLFAQSRRDFSHGCIRVEDPTTLAAWVLQDQSRWNRAAIIAAQGGTATLRAPLTRAMPVVVWYATAVAAPDGAAWFYSDLYGHDLSLNAALQPAELYP
jgi:murein L,D-transpeptidase YcbB/YkuD